MEKHVEIKQPHVDPPEFDAYDKETTLKDALGSQRGGIKKLEVGFIQSVNWRQGVSGWRLTPLGIEFGASTGVFPPGSITFTDIQNISTQKLLGRSTAATGSIEQLGIGASLVLSSGTLKRAALTGDITAAENGNATTLATVNSNVGTFGAAAKTLIATVNAKGLITAISEIAIAIVSTAVTDFIEAAQDAIGAMLDASLTYNDATPSLGVTQTYRRKSLFDHFANVGNVGTGEDDLYSDTIAAGQLSNNGEKLEAQYGGTFVSSATATRQIRIYFGGTAIFDSGALTLSLSAAWDVYVSIVRVSSSVVRYMVSMTTEGAALAAYTSVGEVTGLTLANTNVLKITGEAAGVGAATNDIVAMLSQVEWKAAA